MSTFLSKDEIKELTGYVYKRCQCAHLDEIGVPYHKDRFGNPKVYRAQYEAIKAVHVPATEPVIDIDAMQEAING